MHIIGASNSKSGTKSTAKPHSTAQPDPEPGTSSVTPETAVLASSHSSGGSWHSLERIHRRGDGSLKVWVKNGVAYGKWRYTDGVWAKHYLFVSLRDSTAALTAIVAQLDDKLERVAAGKLRPSPDTYKDN